MNFKQMPLKQRILALAVVLAGLVALSLFTPLLAGGPCQALERARQAYARAVDQDPVLGPLTRAGDFSGRAGDPQEIFTTSGSPGATSYQALADFLKACAAGDREGIEKLSRSQQLFQVQPGNDVILMEQRGEMIHIRPIEGGMDIFTGTWGLRR